MGNAIRPNSFADGQTIDARRVNEDLNTLYEWIRTDAMHRDGSTAFAALPSGPSGALPAQPQQLVNKQYVDDRVGVVRLPNGSNTAPAIRFDNALTTGIHWNSTNGMQFTSDTTTVVRLAPNGAIHFDGWTHLHRRVSAPGMLAAAEGGQAVRRHGNGELFVFTSSEKVKENIREDPIVAAEYASKLLRMRQPVWDALHVQMDEDGEVVEAEPASPDRCAEDRGTKYDRLGPVLEDLDTDFPEAVLYGEDGDPQSLDETLLLSTLIYTVQRLVAELKTKGVLEEGWLA